MSCLLQRIESWWSQLKKHKTRYVVDSRFQGLYGCYNNSFYQLCVHYYNMHRPWNNSHCLIKIMRFISKQLAVHHYSFILCVQPRKCLLIVFSPIIKRSLLCSGMNRIRPSSGDCIGGIPNDLYQMPQDYGIHHNHYVL